MNVVMQTAVKFAVFFFVLAEPLVTASSQTEPKERPFLNKPPFNILTTADADKLYESNRAEFAKGAEELAANYKSGGRGNSENSAFYNALSDAIKVFESNGSGECLAISVAMLKAATGKWYQMPDEQLRPQIDAEGAFNQANMDMKEHCYDLALLYHLTHDKQAAHKAAVILNRYNDVIRDWPLKERNSNERFSQGDDRFKARWDSSGLWGGWVFTSFPKGSTLLYAYDLIYDSGVMQQMGLFENIESMLRYQVEFNETYPRGYGNLDSYGMDVYARFGLLLPEPEYVHLTVQWLDNLLHATYYVDGFWHEGSPSYHKDLTWGLTKRLPELLDGYSDPPGFTSKLDGTRYDNLILSEKYAVQYNRMWEALGKITLPNRTCTVIHDTTFVQQAWWMPEKKHSNPKLLGCMGHLIMAKGAGNHQEQAHLHFSGSHGHEHLDSLNIIVWSQGQEMISSTRYREIPGDVSTREWQSITAGQNTVVIDSKNQLDRLKPHRRRITADDAMPFPDWHYRDYGHGDSLTDGRLRFFASQWAPVQISEAEGEESYHGLADLYRRTLAMVEIDEQHVYLVDVFRVKGGNQHDWMLHGCLEKPYEFQTDLPMSPQQGIEHKYIKDIQVGELGKVSSFSFVYEDGKRSRHWLMMPEGSTLYAGQGPAMRRRGYSPFTFVRHSASSSLFVAVHEFWSDKPKIASVKPMQTISGDPMDAGLQITLSDGTRDMFVSLFDPDSAKRTTFSGDGSQISARGRAAHVRMTPDGTVKRAFAAGLSDLQVGGIDLKDRIDAYKGDITGTKRKETGDSVDALETAVELPTDGTLDGAPIILQYGSELVQSFLIDHIEPLPGGGSLIVLEDDAGITIDGDLIKLHYFPGWGIRGNCSFTIVNTLLVEATDGKQYRIQNQPKSDWPEPVEKGIYSSLLD